MTYKFKENILPILGDTHSTSPLYDILSTRIEDGWELLHVGDVGLGFGKITYAKENALSWLDKLNKHCAKRDIMLYLIRGNHDAPWVWNFPNYSNVILLQEGDYGVFPNGKKAIFVGGGISVDRCARTINEDYWSDEGTNHIENIEKCDIVFSHDAPEAFNHSTATLDRHFDWAIKRDSFLMSDCYHQRGIITDIWKKSEAKTIIYGHFHNSWRQEIEDTYGRCIDINELFFFDSDHIYTV